MCVLPPGAGKTFISWLVISRILSDKPGKLIFFLAPTVSLIMQQLEFFRKKLREEESSFKAHPYFGMAAGRDQMYPAQKQELEMMAELEQVGVKEVQMWNDDWWKKQTRQHQLLLMTPQVCVNVLTHTFIDPADVALLVLDECHHVLEGKHPYAQVMDLMVASRSTRILGLTASPVDISLRTQKPDKLAHLREQLAALERKLRNACALTVSDEREVAAYIARAEDRLVSFSAPAEGPPADNVASQLGPGAAKIADDCILAYKRFQEDEGDSSKEAQRKVLAALGQNSALLEISGLSAQFLCLEAELDRAFSAKESMCGLVFVKTIMTAHLVTALLNVRSKGRFKVRTLTGHGRETDSPFTGMDIAEQQQAITEFAQKKVNLVVATNVAQEGIDIRACDLVIMCNGVNTLFEYIQSKGRARADNSTFVVMTPKLQDVTLDEAMAWLDALKRLFLERAQEPMEEVEWVEDENSGEGVLSGGMAIQIVARACSSLQQLMGQSNPLYKCVDFRALGDENTSLEIMADYLSTLRYVDFDDANLDNAQHVIPLDRGPIVIVLEYADLTVSDASRYACEITLPTGFNLPFCSFWGDPQQSKKQSRHDVAYKCAQLLRTCGLIDKRYLPLKFDVPEFQDNKGAKAKKARRNQTKVYIPKALCTNSGYFLHTFRIGGQDSKMAFLGPCKIMPEIFCFTIYPPNDPAGTAIEQIGAYEMGFQGTEYNMLNEYNAKVRTWLWKTGDKALELHLLVVPLISVAARTIDWDAITQFLNATERTADQCTEEELHESVLSRTYGLHGHFEFQGFSDQTGFYRKQDKKFITFPEYYQERYDIDLAQYPSQRPMRVKAFHLTVKAMFRPCTTSPDKRSDLCFPSSLCHVFPLPKHDVAALCRLPFVTWRLATRMLAYELRQNLGQGIPHTLQTLNLHEEAITASAAQFPFSYERYEFLGDSCLKLALGFEGFCTNPRWDSGILSKFRTGWVSNAALFKLSQLEFGSLGEFAQNYTLDPGTPLLFHPIFYSSVNSTENGESKMAADGMAKWDSNFKERELPKKCVADILEALVGIHYGMRITEDSLGQNWDRALQFCRSLKVGVSSWDCQAASASFKLIRGAPNGVTTERLRRDIEKLNEYTKKWFNYEFKNPALGLAAITHASTTHTHPRLYTSYCYDRLEFLGDAILDFLVAHFLFLKFPDWKPGELHDGKSHLTNNRFLAHLSSKTGLPSLLIHESRLLSETLPQLIIENAEKYTPPDDEPKEDVEEESEQSESEDSVEGAGGEEKQVKAKQEEKGELKEEDKRESEEEESKLKEENRALKVLGDMVESLVGAIWLDLGCDLDKMWLHLQVFLGDTLSNLTREQIVAAFPHKRRLYELVPQRIRVCFRDQCATVLMLWIPEIENDPDDPTEGKAAAGTPISDEKAKPEPEVKGLVWVPDDDKWALQLAVVTGSRARAERCAITAALNRLLENPALVEVPPPQGAPPNQEDIPALAEHLN